MSSCCFSRSWSFLSQQAWYSQASSLQPSVTASVLAELVTLGGWLSIKQASVRVYRPMPPQVFFDSAPILGSTGLLLSFVHNKRLLVPFWSCRLYVLSASGLAYFCSHFKSHVCRSLHLWCYIVAWCSWQTCRWACLKFLSDTYFFGLIWQHLNTVALSEWACKTLLMGISPDWPNNFNTAQIWLIHIKR